MLSADVIVMYVCLSVLMSAQHEAKLRVICFKNKSFRIRVGFYSAGDSEMSLRHSAVYFTFL